MVFQGEGMYLILNGQLKNRLESGNQIPKNFILAGYPRLATRVGVYQKKNTKRTPSRYRAISRLNADEI